MYCHFLKIAIEQVLVVYKYNYVADFILDSYKKDTLKPRNRKVPKEKGLLEVVIGKIIVY